MRTCPLPFGVQGGKFGEVLEVPSLQGWLLADGSFSSIYACAYHFCGVTGKPLFLCAIRHTHIYSTLDSFVFFVLQRKHKKKQKQNLLVEVWQKSNSYFFLLRLLLWYPVEYDLMRHIHLLVALPNSASIARESSIKKVNKAISQTFLEKSARRGKLLLGSRGKGAWSPTGTRCISVEAYCATRQEIKNFSTFFLGLSGALHVPSLYYCTGLKLADLGHMAPDLGN